MTCDSWLSIYEKALFSWHQNKLDEAEQLLNDLSSVLTKPVLKVELFRAYVCRDRGNYLSEIGILYNLFHIFTDSQDRKLLADAWSLLGAALRMLGECRLAVEAFLKASVLEPSSKQKLVECSNAIFVANYVDGFSVEQFLQLYSRYRRLLKDLIIVPYKNVVWQHNKIRVGYVSADLRTHPVAEYIRVMLTLYDSEKFRIYVYQLNPQSDSVTVALNDGVSIWRDTHTMDWEGIASAIREDEIDILVDLSGHTSGNVLPVFAYQPAPIQLSGIGYFNSTGIAEITGFLSDQYCSESDTSSYFTERLIRLQYSHFCYQPFKVFPEVREAPFKRNGFITFGCFNHFSKVTDKILQCWHNILLLVPNSRLLIKHSLLGSEEGCRYVERRMRLVGMPMERVEFRGFSDSYLAEYNDMDIALDTSPYNGGVTTCEALYMGVPVVTLVGDRHGARFGYSFLANLGLEELAAKDYGEYVSLAVKLSQDEKLIQWMHENLRCLMKKSPLMDQKKYMDDLETMYKRLYAHKGEKLCR